ncbi:MAG: Cyanophage, partial [Pseudomonadota bacterium]
MLGVGVGLFQTAIRRAGGPSAWTPADLGAGLALWLDADDAATITLNGSNVSQWRDKSGNGWHMGQAVASAQPAYVTGGLNGKAIIRTDGGDRLDNTATSLFRDVGAATWVAVAKYPATTGQGNAALLMCSRGDANNSTRFMLTA